MLQSAERPLPLNLTCCYPNSSLSQCTGVYLCDQYNKNISKGEYSFLSFIVKDVAGSRILPYESRALNKANFLFLKTCKQATEEVYAERPWQPLTITNANLVAKLHETSWKEISKLLQSIFKTVTTWLTSVCSLWKTWSQNYSS